MTNRSDVDWKRARRAVARRVETGELWARGSALALVQRRTWTQAAKRDSAPVEVFGSMRDDAWLWANTRGLRTEPALRALLPDIPDDHVQSTYTGSAGDVTLREGWAIYRLFKDAYNRHASAGSLSPSTSVLDYGCGWGRITRFFLKDVGPSSIHGIDCDTRMIDLCRRTNRWCKFHAVDVLPPTDLAAASFDLVYAYSVFSHLSEEAHDRWLDEFHRLLKPGGLLIVSTRARSFIKLCAWLRTEQAAGSPASHLVSAGAFADTAASLAEYDQGRYSFSYRSADDPPHFGETCIPKSYVAARWADRFRLLEYIDDRTRCDQNVIVVQKPQA